jgi:hypothetical protein
MLPMLPMLPMPPHAPGAREGFSTVAGMLDSAGSMAWMPIAGPARQALQPGTAGLCVQMGEAGVAGGGPGGLCDCMRMEAAIMMLSMSFTLYYAVGQRLQWR